MAVVFAILMEAAAVLCAAGVLFAGMMRTTGGDSDDSRTALLIFICGTIVAALVGASHWVGW